MNKELQAKISQAVYSAYWKVFHATPKDTWNMAVNALKIEATENGVIIYIDEAVAPYVFYTNEPWISPWWGGKKNPNEGWFDKIAVEVVFFLGQFLGGTVEKVEEGVATIDD